MKFTCKNKELGKKMIWDKEKSKKNLKVEQEKK